MIIRRQFKKSSCSANTCLVLKQAAIETLPLPFSIGYAYCGRYRPFKPPLVTEGSLMKMRSGGKGKADTGGYIKNHPAWFFNFSGDFLLHSFIYI